MYDIDSAARYAESLRPFAEGMPARTGWLSGPGDARPRLLSEKIEQARKLRAEGWSYPQIAKEVATPKSTLWRYCKDVPKGESR